MPAKVRRPVQLRKYNEFNIGGNQNQCIHEISVAASS